MHGGVEEDEDVEGAEGGGRLGHFRLLELVLVVEALVGEGKAIIADQLSSGVTSST